MYLMTGGRAFTFPFGISSFDFLLEIDIFVSVAQSCSMCIESFPNCSICLLVQGFLVSPSMTNETLSAKAIQEGNKSDIPQQKA